MGYRQFTRAQANSLGLVGWVRNLDDGRVEVEVTGDDEKLASFIAKLKKGPNFSHVEGLDITDLSETVDSDEFVIL